jgi:hypothetical protein
MRFCGYRKNYQNFIYLFAQEKTYQTFEMMNEIENVVWNMANKWNNQKLDIYKNFPRVLYASRSTAKLEPTRRSVQDPDLLDKSLGEAIFTTRNIGSPQLTKNKSSHTKRVN